MAHYRGIDPGGLPAQPAGLAVPFIPDYLEGKNQNYFRQEDIEKTAKAFEKFETVERYCTVADLGEIKENDFNLNISRYVDTTEPEKSVNITNVLSNLDSLGFERKEIQKKLNRFVKELGY